MAGAYSKDGKTSDYDSSHSGRSALTPPPVRSVVLSAHSPTTPGDFSGNNELVLFGLQKAGQKLKALLTLIRNGFFYVSDGTTASWPMPPSSKQSPGQAHRPEDWRPVKTKGQRPVG